MPIFRIVLLFAGLFGAFFWLPLDYAVPIGTVIAAVVCLEFFLNYVRMREARSEEISRGSNDAITVEVSPATLRDLLAVASGTSKGKSESDNGSGRRSGGWSGLDGGADVGGDAGGD